MNDNITFKITQSRLLFSYTYKIKRIQEVKPAILFFFYAITSVKVKVVVDFQPFS